MFAIPETDLRDPARWVGASFVDAHGRTWRFRDKLPIFVADERPLPCDGAIRCQVVARRHDATGRLMVAISTASPDSVTATEDDATTFEVLPEQVEGSPPGD